MKTKNLISSALKSQKISTPLTDDVEILADELDRLQSIKNVWESEDGKILLDVLRTSCAGYINHLRTLTVEPDLLKILGCLAQYFSTIDLIASLRQVKSINEIQYQIDEAVKKLRDVF